MFTLSKDCIAKVNQFNGQYYVDIRKYYEDKITGKQKPTSKGISLTIKQFEKLLNNMDKIDELLAQ
ncbi:Transcriptional_coactivator p15 domain-containing protein [Hexamita inflata]|uniref:Transcriptional coactivator p15 domain-containing protein n=1 Tax=Hexamita inflata TaxID=28002 RepID=A0AA86TXK6_9EUKA|nr:Transcriptional coactivator p15 domain-containing protein [Hexamita inflata]